LLLLHIRAWCDIASTSNCQALYIEQSLNFGLLIALLQTLAYNAGMYSRAQALRRDGTAPAAMGVADDLPTRMAYQQLNILAGMAGKVRNTG
jgi:hypothetical protein